MADLKLDTLIKVLLMTTSDNNSEALAAIRRANHLLKVANIDWEKLLKGKVTVVADPFADIPAPPRPATTYSPNSSPTVPQRPQQYDAPVDYTPPTPPAYKRKPIPPSAASLRTSYSPQAARKNNTNSFAGNCFNCDLGVPAGYGALRDIQGKTHVFCEDCNYNISNGSISLSSVINTNYARKLKQAELARQAKQATSYTPRVKRKVTTKDLMSDIFDTPKSGSNVDY